jgi:hypothetical protein
MAVSFDNLDEGQVTEIKGMGLLEDPKMKFTFRGSPSPTNMSKILTMHPSERNYIPGGVPFNGYVAYIYCVKAMHLFSYMSQAYSQEASQVRYNDVEFHDGALYRKVTDTGIDLQTVMGDAVLSKVLKKGEIGNSKFDTVIQQTPGFLAIPLTDIRSIPTSFISFKGRPTGTQGILCPYFKFMVEPDKIQTASIFSRLFFRCLGSNMKHCGNLWARIRLGLRSLALTEAGQALSHAFTGIQLAENSQSGIQFIVDNGSYHGFIILGRINLILNGQVLPSIPEAELYVEFQRLNMSDKSKQDILQIIHTPTTPDGTQIYHASIDDMSSSRKTMELLHSLNQEVFTPEQRKEISRLVDQLSFGHKYAEVNRVNLLACFDYILTGEPGILSAYGTYLTGGYGWVSDRVAVAFGIFGPLAPLFNYGQKKEKQISFPGIDAKEDNNMKMVDGKRGLPLLSYRLVPVRHAVQMTDHMLSSGVLFIPHGKKIGKDKISYTDASKYDGKIDGDPMVEIYLKMKACVNLKRQMGGNRKRKLDRSEEEKSKKKSKKGHAQDDEDAMLL